MLLKIHADMLTWDSMYVCLAGVIKTRTCEKSSRTQSIPIESHILGRRLLAFSAALHLPVSLCLLQL